MPAKPRKIPQRQCVGCRVMKDKKALIRVVKTPEGDGSVVDANVLGRQVKVKFTKGDDISFKMFPVDEVSVLRSSGKKDKKENAPAKNQKKN